MTRSAHGRTGLVLLLLLGLASSAGASQAWADRYDAGRPLADRMELDLHDSGLWTDRGAETVRTESRFAELAPTGAGSGSGAIPTPIAPPSLADRVISQPGANAYVDRDLVLHRIPDDDTYQCLLRTKTVIARSSVSDAQYNALSRGADATCSGPLPVADEAEFTGAEPGFGQQPQGGGGGGFGGGGLGALHGVAAALADSNAKYADKVISQPGIGYYVDPDLVLHYIPDGDTYNCLIRTKAEIDRSSVSDAEFNAFTRGPDATCSGPGRAELARFADKVISQPGVGYYVDPDLVLHYIPDGDTYNCLIRTKTEVDRSSVSDALFNAFTRGPNATCSGPGRAELARFADKVISQPGVGYYVDSDLVLRYIPDGDTYNCLIRTKTEVDRSSVSDALFNAFTRGPNATCN